MLISCRQYGIDFVTMLQFYHSFIYQSKVRSVIFLVDTAKNNQCDLRPQGNRYNDVMVSCCCNWGNGQIASRWKMKIRFLSLPCVEITFSSTCSIPHIPYKLIWLMILYKYRFNSLLFWTCLCSMKFYSCENRSISFDFNLSSKNT